MEERRSACGTNQNMSDNPSALPNPTRSSGNNTRGGADERVSSQRDEQARQFALQVVRRLREAGYEAYWAGGCVRDYLLGLTPHDYDVATSARPEEVQRLFRRTVTVGASFGVVEVLGPRLDGETISVQVATFRSEGPYSDGRHPDSVVFTNAVQDAQRRDFTINGLFYDPLTGQVLDYVGGKQDLQARILRAIGNPRERFQEDKLRILRAVRLAAQFNLTIEPETAEAIRAMADQITVVSAERIAEELRRLLTGAGRVRGLELLHELGLLSPIFPELADMPKVILPQPIAGQSRVDHPPEAEAGSLSQDKSTNQTTLAIPVAAEQAEKTLEGKCDAGPGSQTLWEHTLRVVGWLREPGFPLSLAALFHDAGKAKVASSSLVDMSGKHSVQNSAFPEHEKIGAELVEHAGRRLRLANAEWQRAAWLVAHHHALDAPWNLPMHVLKPLLAHPAIHELLELIRANLLAHNRSLEPIAFCETKLQEWPREVLDPPPLVSGDDLIALGLKPGPIFKQLLQRVREAQLDGLIASREEALEMLRQWLQQNRPSG
jgi:poly(A) polymerase